MKHKWLRVCIVFATVASTLLVGSAAKPATPGSGASEHQRIVDFWTNERVTQAVPRDFVKAGPNQYQLAGEPDRGGKPGGGGGGGSTGTITGASWNGGGVVADTTGKVLFAMGASYYVCSASVVTDSASDRSIVLTAGHCVYDEAGGAFATNWMFVPNYDAAAPNLTTSGSFCGQTLYGCWTATSLVAHSGYTTAGGFNDQAVVFDFGFAILGNGGKSPALVESIVGSQAITFDANGAGTVVDAFGYPAARKYNGKDLVYCEGPTGFDSLNNDATYKIACNMTGGSSGGPWLRTFNKTTGQGTLTSVNSYGYTGDKSMYGPKFNADTEDLYQAALTTSANQIVP
jgi:hypothetical protein